MNGCERQTRRRVRLYLMAIVAGCGLGSLLATAGVKVLQTLTGDEAIQHVGETKTVCGTIASAKYMKGSPANITYLNFDYPYPKQTCAALIAGTARAKFQAAPETALAGKWVCITGLISTNRRGQAQIEVSDPSQIVVENTPTPPVANRTTAPTSP